MGLNTKHIQSLSRDELEKAYKDCLGFIANKKLTVEFIQWLGD